MRIILSIAALLLAVQSLSTTVTAQPTINWSTLNATSLAALQPSDVAGASQQDLAAIPPAACTGWTQTLFAQAGGGDPYTQCSGFTTGCLSNIPVAAIAGINEFCTGALTSDQLNAFAPTQFAAIPTTSIQSLTKTSISGMVAPCAGMTPAQMAAIGSSDPYDQCSGFTTACVQLIPSASFTPGSICIEVLTTAVMGGLTSGQVASIPVGSIGSLTKAQMAAINPSACAGFDQHQTAPLGESDSYDACSSIVPACFATMQPIAFSGLGSTCVQVLSADAWSTITAAQLAQVQVTPLTQLSKVTLGGINGPACAGLSKDQVQAIGSASPYDACSMYTAACISAIPATSTPGFTTQCFGIIPMSVIPAFSADQVAGWTGDAVGALTEQQLSAMGASCAGLTPESIAFLGAVSPYNSCSGLQKACIQAITLPAMAQLGNLCFPIIPDASIAALTAAQLGAVSLPAITSLTQQQFATLNQQCSGLTVNQTAVLSANSPYDECVMMTSACLSSMTDSAVSGLIALCVETMAPATIAALSASQLGSLSPAAVASLTHEQVAQLNQQCSGFLYSQTVMLSSVSPYDECTQLTQQCASAMTDSAVSGLIGLCVGTIPSGSIVGFSIEQLSFLTPQAISGMIGPQILALYAAYKQAFVNAWSATQANSLPAIGAMDEWNKAVVKGTIAQGPSWTATTNLTAQSQLQLSVCPVSCMSIVFAGSGTPNKLEEATWGGMQAIHVVALRASADVAWLSDPHSWGAWPAPALGALSPAQVVELPSAMFQFLLPGSFDQASIPSFTNEDIKAMSYESWSSMECSKFRFVTPMQYAYLATVYPTAAEFLTAECGSTHFSSTGIGPTPPPTPDQSTGSGPTPPGQSTGAGPTPGTSTGSGPTPPAPVPSSSSTGGSDSPTSPASGLSTGAKIGIGVGASVGGIGLFALIFFCGRRSAARSTGLDEHLLSANQA